ncbi:MAG: class I SAM-dependent methyltransferase [Kiritimatiellae bacterium]|nr:class I SAM-dependent methyltransferase [Kiritimatiellia bacterium]
MKKIVVCGARSGKYPLEILAREPDCELAVHAYDAYQARKIGEDLGVARERVEIMLAANLPPGRTWDRGYFYADAKLMSAELQLDCLQDLFAHVPSGDVVGVDKPTRKKATSRMRDFRCTWQASVPGGEKLSFVSYPGCFCHRRADEGGLALAEVVSRELSASGDRLPPLHFLDMGCGSGFVGLLVAKSLPPGRVRLTSVDSHVRAIMATKENALALGVACDAILSDVGTPPETDGTFDVVAMNPPYYGDWSIAGLFFETAFRALKPGGVCHAVAKNGFGLRKEAEKRFPKTELVSRRGYVVLKCTKSSLK